MVRYTKQSSNQIPQQKSDTPATSLMSIRTRSRPPSNPTTHPRQQTIPGPEWPPIASCPNCCSVVSAAPGASQEGGRRWSTKIRTMLGSKQSAECPDCSEKLPHKKIEEKHQKYRISIQNIRIKMSEP